MHSPDTGVVGLAEITPVLVIHTFPDTKETLIDLEILKISYPDYYISTTVISVIDYEKEPNTFQLLTDPLVVCFEHTMNVEKLLRG